MYWDGDAWQPLLWKDFAVWTTADAAPKRRASDVQIELDFAVHVRDEVDVRVRAE